MSKKAVFLLVVLSLPLLLGFSDCGGDGLVGDSISKKVDNAAENIAKDVGENLGKAAHTVENIANGDGLGVGELIEGVTDKAFENVP